MPERDPYDRTYDRAFFGFRARDHMENVAPEDPLQRFVLRCDGCHNGEVQIQVDWHEGEVRGALVCLRCRRREALPSRLLRCDT